MATSFFADRYFGFDDAIYATGRLLEILSQTGETVTELLMDLPTAVVTPEIRRYCPDELKFQVVAGLKERLADKFPLVDIDGVRLLHSYGWGLVRASNTQPALVLRFEARTQEQHEKIRNLMEAALNAELAELGEPMSTTSANSLFGVILAGGSGTRFWPLSRSQYPKQVLRLLGADSLLQSTIKRLLPRVPLESLAVVTNAIQADVIRLDLYQQGWQQLHLWLEPEGRNTAAAVALAAAMMGRERESDIIAVFPADHYIRDQERFLEALDRGANLAQAGYLVTFGIAPTRPDTGYGYIKVGESLPPAGYGFRAASFIEKPDLERAQAFLAAGGYYWNSGIFLFRRDVLLEAFRRHLPTLSASLPLLDTNNQAALAEVYHRLPSISLDHGIMEKADNVAVVPMDMGWSDVGTWGALHELFPQDGQGNVILGRALDLDSQNSLMFSQNRLLATIGLKDLVVVNTVDATLVCHRSRAQQVKELVAELNNRNMVESVHHPTVERPWGRYTVLDSGPGFQVKQVEVDPGKRLSLQLHEHRAEHWVVVQGTALITIGQEIKEVCANESVFVPLRTAHRLENQTLEPVRIIEVQTGSYLGEDDIVRFADDFWRVSEDEKHITQ